MKRQFALVAAVCLCMTLLGSAAGAETSTAMLRGIQFVQMQTEYVVDDILAFLKSFDTDLTNQIANLDDAVKVETAYLESVIADLQNQKQDKTVECSAKSDAANLVIKKYNDQLDFVNWITKRINDDYQKISDYQKQSCQQTLDFVNYLAQSQLALNLSEFIRNALEGYSFTQMRPIARIVRQFSKDTAFYATTEGLEHMVLQFQSAIHQVDSSAYHTGDSLNSGVSDRSSDEIGTGHIDNDKGDIDLDSFQGGKRMGLSAIKAALFKLLDQLEATLKKNMNDRINSMISLAETIADYINVLEKEIIVLQKDLVTQQEILREIELEVKAAQDVVAQCQSEFNQIVQKITDTQEKHDKYIHDRSAFRKVLLDQLDQLAAIINIYESKIAVTGENYKSRYDDILDNDTIDYSAKVDDRDLYIDYNAIQAPDQLGSHVETEIVPTAPDQNDDSITF